MTSKELYLRLLHYVIPHKGIFALSILGTVILAATEPALPALFKVLLDGSFIEKDPDLIIVMPLMLIGLYVIRGGANYTSSVAMRWVATRIVMELRGQMLDKILSLPAPYFDNHASGTTLSKLTFDVTRVMHAATSVLITLIRDSLMIVGLMAYSLYLNWQLALVAFLVAPPTVAIIRVVSKRLRGLSRKLQSSMGELTSVIQEAIIGNREIKIFGGQAYEQDRFRHINNWVRRYHMKVAAVSEASVPIGQILMVTALALVIYVASLQSQAGEITVSGFVALIGAIALMSSPMKRLTKLNEELQAGLAAAESIFGLIDEEAESDTGSRSLGRAQGDVKFENVSFIYSADAGKVLDNVNLHFPPGNAVALVGHSGSGKTTLAHLLPRFYTPSAGRILLDDVDIQELSLANLRANIAHVGQNIVLFDDTIAANIAYGAFETTSHDRIVDIARHAHALEFIEKLPNGFDTVVGENGVRLSGGQRQRIAIARAMLKDAPILILDEATSALDTQSEKMVQAALETLQKGRTSIIIAHRLTTIENADHIIVMHEGRIAEQGDHASLLTRGGVYAKLYRLQDAQAEH